MSAREGHRSRAENALKRKPRGRHHLRVILSLGVLRPTHALDLSGAVDNSHDKTSHPAREHDPDGRSTGVRNPIFADGDHHPNQDGMAAFFRLPAEGGAGPDYLRPAGSFRRACSIVHHGRPNSVKPNRRRGRFRHQPACRQGRLARLSEKLCRLRGWVRPKDARHAPR